MAKTSGDNYVFGRDLTESYRLNYGHWHHTAAFGHLLHPDIPVKDNLRVADVGGGTGIWSIFLARLLRNNVKNVNIDCFDISAEQYPTEPWRNKEVSYHVQDGFKPFPLEFHQQFDIVHVRFWLTFVNNEDVPALLENFKSLLKPGGYLQWTEPVFAKSVLIKKESNLSSEWTEKSQARFKQLTSKKTWPADLPQLCLKAGYESIAATEYTIPDELRHIGRPYSVAGTMNSKTMNEEDRERASKQEGEFRSGVVSDTVFQVFVARRVA